MRKRITKVTTKTGDDGTTAMADGSRVSKSEARINCIGEVDELNSLIGYLRSVDCSAKYDLSLMRIQNCLFDIGGSLSLGTDQSISQEEILYLEKEINILNGSLPELENFILPGGSPASSLAQYARSVCRRCERSLVKLKEEIKIEDNKLVYLNRLSDLMFVIGRCLNRDAGIEENFWNQS